MSATLRRVPATKVPLLYPSKAFSCLPTMRPLDHSPNPPAQSTPHRAPISQLEESSFHCSLYGFSSSSCGSSSSSCCNTSYSDYLYRNFPNTSNWHCINSIERRMIEVRLAKIVKTLQGDVLDRFLLSFCPILLVKVMKLLDSRDAALAFFKLAFYDDYSDNVVHSCCLAAHLLAAENLRLLAQDVVSWVIFRIGVCRSWEMVKFMWEHHHDYESDLSVLDTLMRSFLNVELGYEALEVLAKMREVGIKPCYSAMDILFKWLFRVGDYHHVSRLLRDMMCKGPFPSNFLFNTLIHGFCRKGEVGIGETLLHVMWRYGCWPDVYAYNILIKAHCMRGDTSKAQELFNMIKYMGCERNHVTYNTVISTLCRTGKVADARSLFKESGLCPSLFIYNSLMDGCVKARDLVQAKMLYEEMRMKDVLPDCVTFNILFSGHHKYGRKEDGDWLLEELKELTDSNKLEEYALHDSYVAGMCWKSPDKAAVHLKSILEKGISVSLFAFNSIIAAYSRIKEENKAYEVYRLMVQFGFSPSSSTCSYLLMGLCRKGMLREARNLLNEMIEKGSPVNKAAFTILLDGYFKKGDEEEAERLWNEMKSRGLSPDVVAYSAYIDGLSKAGQLEAAGDTFKEMLEKVKPNNYVYSSLICGLCSSGRLDEAWKLQREMIENGLHPDIFTFNAIINGYCKKGLLGFAKDAFMEMKRFGVTPDVVTYNTLIHAHCREVGIVGAEIFRKKTRGWNPDITTFNIRIHGFCTIVNMNTAVKLLDELVSLGFVPNTVTYNSMVNGMCRDILDNAMVLTGKLIKMAFVPNVVTVNTLLSQYCKQGMPEKTLMWMQSLRDISFDFDDISYDITVRAQDKLVNEKVVDDDEYDREFCRATSDNCPTLDFLMTVTYYYLCRSKLQTSRSHQPLILSGSCFDRP